MRKKGETSFTVCVRGEIYTDSEYNSLYNAYRDRFANIFLGKLITVEGIVNSLTTYDSYSEYSFDNSVEVSQAFLINLDDNNPLLSQLETGDKVIIMGRLVYVDEFYSILNYASLEKI